MQSREERSKVWTNLGLVEEQMKAAQKRVNSAKAELGTARTELVKLEQEYARLYHRLHQLLPPPEDAEGQRAAVKEIEQHLELAEGTCEITSTDIRGQLGQG